MHNTRRPQGKTRSANTQPPRHGIHDTQRRQNPSPDSSTHNPCQNANAGTNRNIPREHLRNRNRERRRDVAGKQRQPNNFRGLIHQTYERGGAEEASCGGYERGDEYDEEIFLHEIFARVHGDAEGAHGRSEGEEEVIARSRRQWREGVGFVCGEHVTEGLFRQLARDGGGDERQEGGCNEGMAHFVKGRGETGAKDKRTDGGAHHKQHSEGCD
mmetsp:Transcript_3957/g.5113  ORF Transcript_3957/g.5113 Transcript_3957/m.5113 type:complete len:214 (-) Transcript_3957:74-715(-)